MKGTIQGRSEYITFLLSFLTLEIDANVWTAVLPIRFFLRDMVNIEIENGTIYSDLTYSSSENEFRQQ